MNRWTTENGSLTPSSWERKTVSPEPKDIYRGWGVRLHALPSIFGSEMHLVDSLCEPSCHIYARTVVDSDNPGGCCTMS